MTYFSYIPDKFQEISKKEGVNKQQMFKKSKTEWFLDKILKKKIFRTPTSHSYGKVII